MNTGIVLTNFVSQIGAKIASVTAGFITILVLRRFWGVSEFGNYIYIISLLTLLASVSDFGTHLVSVNQLAKAKDYNSMASSMILLKLGLVLVVFLASLVILPLPAARPLVILIGIKNILLVIFHSKLKLYFSALGDLLVSLLILVVAVLVWQFDLSVAGYFRLVCLAYLVGMLPFLQLVVKKFNLRFQPRFSEVKKLFWQSFPLGLVLVSYTAYSRLDALMLKHFWGVSTLGVYGLSYKVYENLVLPAAFLMNAILPFAAARTEGKNKRYFAFLLHQTFDILIFSSIVLALLFYILAPFIIYLFSGAFTTSEILVFRLLLLALPFAYLNHLTGYTNIVLAQQKKTLIIALLALLFNFSANFLLIPAFSYNAAAVVTVATEILVFVLSFKLVKSKIQFRPKVYTFPKTIYFLLKTKGGLDVTN